MTEKKLVDINTGQPVKSIEKESTGGVRKALIQDGKRWQKMLQKMKDGEIQIHITAVGQEIGLDEIVIPYFDSLINDDDKAKRHKDYLKYKSKNK